MSPKTRSRSDVSTESRRGRFPSPSISAVIARVELRRMVRRVRAQDVWLALVAVSSLIFVAILPLVFDIGRDWGAAFASGDAGPASTVGLVLATAWVFQVAMGVVAGVGSYGEVDNEAAMLTIRPPKDVAGGMLLMNVAGYAPYLFVPVTAGFAGIAVGAGTPAPLVGGVVATAAILASAMALGYPAGVALKGAIRRSAWLSRLKPVLGAGVGVAYFWVMFSGRLPAVVDALEPVLRGPPLGWLADLALATTPDAGADPLGVAAVLVLTLVAVPVGTLATVEAATFAWFVDEARETDESVDGSAGASADSTAAEPTGSTRLGDTLGALARRQGTVGVAAVTLVRAYRAPLQLVFAALPLLFALPMVEGMLATGSVPSYAPWFAMCYGAWAAGVAAPLNLLGNQGAALPALLTTRARGRAVVRGTVLAVVAPLAPLTAVLAGTAAHATGHSPVEAALFGGLGLAVVTAGSVLAAALGALFPRFDGVDVTGDRTATPPSKAAFSLFSVVVVLAVSAAGVLTDRFYRLAIHAMVTPRLPFGLSLTVAGLERLAFAVAALLVVAVPAAYVLAVRRVDGYRLA